MFQRRKGNSQEFFGHCQRTLLESIWCAHLINNAQRHAFFARKLMAEKTELFGGASPDNSSKARRSQGSDKSFSGGGDAKYGLGSGNAQGANQPYPEFTHQGGNLDSGNN